MTTVDAGPTTARLLAGLGAGVGRLDLASHAAVHGPLAVPGRRDRRWADSLVEVIERSGITGRGGAGFPTARKLETLRSERRRPLVVVNAMEGEPASRKDQFLATRVPHLVLDGAALLAACVNAPSISVCVARGADTAARSFGAAVAERERAGLDPVPITVLRPPGRYVAGEESALSNWLAGNDSRPQYRPDRPAIPRVKGRPALVDNAETLAHIALLARYGAEWFRELGTQGSPGTTLITVSGAVDDPGILEVPFGTPVAAVLANAGAGSTGGVLLGGFGGTWLASGDVGTPYDPVSLGAVGCTTGVGVMVALPPGGCGLAETARIAHWMASESAGQCGPCAFGLPAVAQDLTMLARGRAGHRDADRLWARLGMIEGRGACRHPDGVVRLLRSAVTAFADDVNRHLSIGPCPGAAWPSVVPLPRTQEVMEWR